VLAHSTKVKMFGFLKNLLRKSPETSAENYQDAAYETADAPTAEATPKAPVFKAPPLRRNPSPANGHSKGIEIGLDAVIQGLPLELQPRVRRTDVGELSITVPLEKVLAQLSRGAVKVSFGELRQAAPDVFTAQNDRDRVLVALPLAEILAKLNPTLIARRRVQKQIEVPAEISSPFEDHGERLAASIAAAKAEAESVVSPPIPSRHAAAAPPPALAPAPAAIPSRSSISMVSSTVPAELNAAPAPAPVPRSNGARPAVAPTPKPSVPSASVVPHAPPAPAPAKPAPAPSKLAPAPAKAAVPFNPNPTLVKPVSPIDPTPIAVSQAVPSAVATPAPKPVAHPPRESVAAAAVPMAPAAPAAPVTPAAPVETLVVGLASIAEGWPEEIRKEIISLRLAEAKVALPVSSIEQALRQGRICFSWKSLRAWLKPAVPAVASSHDGAVLDLPLKLVAPLFLERQREAAKSKQKVSIDEDIPNLFFGFPQPEGTPSPAVATARSSDTNYYVWEDSHDTARIHESEVKRGPSPGTKFVAKYATPNEVVSRAAGLEGVVGALIALPDGLMVANRLPPDLNADTLAAFLPQIFGKVSQCTKELRMGELNNLNFTVGNVPWKIFRVNAIFFAAFGQAGLPLPTAQLAALAAELDHKPK
jgi:predicted regulator of Ras-like GTPase activity (Roadblock/LC7/MglB family)